MRFAVGTMMVMKPMRSPRDEIEHLRRTGDRV